MTPTCLKEPMDPDRTSGLLLHPTSLPGPHGSGDLAAAPWFIERLDEMRQSWWQMLPIGPTGYGNSPYQSPSTFAGNPLLVGFEPLVGEGLLTKRELASISPSAEGDVDFDTMIPLRTGALHHVTRRFSKRASTAMRGAFENFMEQHGSIWLDDFALFTAIKRANELRPWWEWDRSLAQRAPEALAGASATLWESIHHVKVEQFLFDRQLHDVRALASANGVGLIGDIPIFVAHDSADVWANRDQFHLDEDGMPTVVAGVPPDYFSVTGQRWGNPLYDWDRHVETGFVWWESRLRRMFEFFDLVRVDHFRGFAASWHIPASEPTAVNGEWIEAPGEALFDTLASRFPSLDVIAEDLGLITPDVEALRDRYGLPGMKVLQFGFGTESAHAISEFRPNVVAYTGTHDNDTARGWFDSRAEENPAELETVISELGSTAETFAWDLVEAVMASVANTVIIPVQDLLGLGTEARMNEPGTTLDNWTWRLRPGQLDTDIVERMARLTIETHRAREEGR
jgi:4-alpha-glucanotransferase